MFGSNMARKVPAAAANDPDTARFAVWYDVLGLDSEYDYDPVWKKCVELGTAPTFHSASSNQGRRLSPTNFTYNHIGHFAAAGHATAEAIFLGGRCQRSAAHSVSPAPSGITRHKLPTLGRGSARLPAPWTQAGDGAWSCIKSVIL